MNSKEKQILQNSIVVSILIALLLFAILVMSAPDSTAYSVNNYGWNGLQQMNAKYSLHEIDSISDAVASNKSVLLEIAPSTQFSSAEGEMARSFVESGGTLIVADNSGVSNSLLRGIGAHILVSGNVVCDPVFNWKHVCLPLAEVSNTTQLQHMGGNFLLGVSTLALSSASSLSIAQQSDNITIIATSSPQSEALNPSTSALISKGPLAIAAVEYIGAGKLIVIGDSTFFLNSVWTQADNQILINNLLSGSKVYLDTSSWPVNTLTTIKAGLLSLYSSLSTVPFRYLSALGLIGGGVLVFRTVDSIWSFEEEGKKEGQGEEEEEEGKNSSRMKRRASMFNNAILEHVRKDREKYGTGASN